MEEWIRFEPFERSPIKVIEKEDENQTDRFGKGVLLVKPYDKTSS